ncbi:MAG: hypothetical protein R3C29_03120 [Dehalococcoidia bacterium]
MRVFVVTKVVDWGEQVEDNTQTFTICIEGPSYTLPADAAEARCDADSNGGELTFDGSIPGDYTVTENDPGAEWGVSGDDVTVDARPAARATHHHQHHPRGRPQRREDHRLERRARRCQSDSRSASRARPTPMATRPAARQDVNPGNTTAQWKDLEVGDYTVTENFRTGIAPEWTPRSMVSPAPPAAPP